MARGTSVRAVEEPRGPDRRRARARPSQRRRGELSSGHIGRADSRRRGSLEGRVAQGFSPARELEMRKGMMLLAIIAAAIGAPAAQDNTAWFGTPGPPALSDPRKPVMKYDDAFAPLPTA